MTSRRPLHELTDEELVERLRQLGSGAYTGPVPDGTALIERIMERIRSGQVEPPRLSVAQRFQRRVRVDLSYQPRESWRNAAASVTVIAFVVVVGFVLLARGPYAERIRTLASVPADLYESVRPAPPVQPAPSEAGWQTTSPLLTPRGSHGIARLEDGRALITGGNNVALHYNAELLHSSELFDPSSNTWSATGSLNTARFWFGNIVTLRNGKVLVAGGTDNTGYGDFNSCELYDPETGRWSFTGALDTPRRLAPLVLLNDGRVLIVGGADGPPDDDRFLASAELYDPETETWTTTSNMATPRENHWAVQMLDGRVMVGGGEQPGGVIAGITEIYDPENDFWAPAGRLSAGRASPAVVVLPDGRVLVAGGSNFKSGEESLIFASAEVYSPVTAQWSLVSPMNVPRNAASAHVLRNGTVLIVDGANDEGVVATTEIYDPVADNWTTGPDWPTPRRGPGVVILDDGSVLAAGGWVSGPDSVGLVGSDASDRYFPLGPP